MLTDYGDGILTCFHCGIDARVAGGGEPRLQLQAGRLLGWRVVCGLCGARGPTRKIDAEAKAAWNHIQSALEAFEDAMADRGEPEYVTDIGTPKQQEQLDRIAAFDASVDERGKQEGGPPR